MYQIPPDALNMDQAAAFIGSNVYTFRSGYKTEGVPHTWIGGKLCFFPNDLAEWRAKNPTRLVKREAA